MFAIGVLNTAPWFWKVDVFTHLGAGVISDISTPSERGGFYGVYALGPMVGTSDQPAFSMTDHLLRLDLPLGP